MRANQHGQKHLERLQNECAIFNAAVKAGDTVTYRRDSGDLFHTRTRSAAYVLSDHTAVVFVEGVSGCVLLSRVQKEDSAV